MPSILIYGASGTGKSCFLGAVYATAGELDVTVMAKDSETKRYLSVLADALRRGDVPAKTALAEPRTLRLSIATGRQRVPLELRDYPGEVIEFLEGRPGTVDEVELADGLVGNAARALGIMVVVEPPETRPAGGDVSLEVRAPLDVLVSRLREKRRSMPRSQQSELPFAVVVTKLDAVSVEGAPHDPNRLAEHVLERVDPQLLPMLREESRRVRVFGVSAFGTARRDDEGGFRPDVSGGLLPLNVRAPLGWLVHEGLDALVAVSEQRVGTATDVHALADAMAALLANYRSLEEPPALTEHTRRILAQGLLRFADATAWRAGTDEAAPTGGVDALVARFDKTARTLHEVEQFLRTHYSWAATLSDRAVAVTEALGRSRPKEAAILARHLAGLALGEAHRDTFAALRGRLRKRINQARWSGAAVALAAAIFIYIAATASWEYHLYRVHDRCAAQTRGDVAALGECRSKYLGRHHWPPLDAWGRSAVDERDRDERKAAAGQVEKDLARRCDRACVQRASTKAIAESRQWVRKRLGDLCQGGITVEGNDEPSADGPHSLSLATGGAASTGTQDQYEIVCERLRECGNRLDSCTQLGEAISSETATVFSCDELVRRAQKIGCFEQEAIQRCQRLADQFVLSVSKDESYVICNDKMHTVREIRKLELFKGTDWNKAAEHCSYLRKLGFDKLDSGTVEDCFAALESLGDDREGDARDKCNRRAFDECFEMAKSDLIKTQGRLRRKEFDALEEGGWYSPAAGTAFVAEKCPRVPSTRREELANKIRKQADSVRETEVCQRYEQIRSLRDQVASGGGVVDALQKRLEEYVNMARGSDPGVHNVREARTLLDWLALRRQVDSSNPTGQFKLSVECVQFLHEARSTELCDDGFLGGTTEISFGISLGGVDMKVVGTDQVRSTAVDVDCDDPGWWDVGVEFVTEARLGVWTLNLREIDTFVDDRFVLMPSVGSHTRSVAVDLAMPAETPCGGSRPGEGSDGEDPGGPEMEARRQARLISYPQTTRVAFSNDGGARLLEAAIVCQMRGSSETEWQSCAPPQLPATPTACQGK